jgi:hypothetical protein
MEAAKATNSTDIALKQFINGIIRGIYICGIAVWPKRHTACIAL